jgi:hypothetical protein
MKPGHHIRTQRMELSFQDESRANELHTLVRDLCCHEIERALEQSLDLFNSHHSVVYTFNEVVLDLGDIEWRDLRKQLPERIAAELTRVLKESFLQANAAPEVTILKSGARDINSMHHFLRYGYLPWNSSHRNALILLEQMVDTNAAALASTIREAGAFESVRVRMTERFPGVVMRKIIGVLEPSHAQTIMDYHQHLGALNKQESIVRVPHNELEKALWLFVLNHLLAEQGSDFNRRALATSMLRQFSCHYNIAFTELLLLMKTGLQRWRGAIPVPFQSLVDDLLLQSLSSDDRNETDNGPAILSKRPKKPSALSSFSTLEDLMDYPEWKVLLTDGLKNDPVSWLTLLRNTQDKPLVLYQLLSQSGPKLPGRLIRAMEPVESVAIIQYHANLTALHTADPIPNTARREVEDMLWTFIIVHLIENKGSYFNHKAYLKSLIISFSSHYNLHAVELLDRLLASGSHLQGPSSGMNRFLVILQEIHDDMTDHKPGNQAGHAAVNSRIPYTALIEQLRHDVVRPSLENDVVQLLKTDRQATEQLITNLSDITLRERLAGFSATSFKQLLTYLFPSSAVDLVRQFVHLTYLAEPQLREAFATASHYQKTVQQIILDLAPTTHQFPVSHARLYNLLLRSLVTRAPRLKMVQVRNWMAWHRDHPRLTLLKKFLQPTNETAAILNGTIADEWVSRLIHATKHGRADFIPGYKTLAEAWSSLHQRYPKLLLPALKRLSDHERAQLVDHLEPGVMDVLLDDKTTASWYSEVLRVWGSLLTGYHRRSEIMNSLKRTLLLSFVWSDVPSLDTLSDGWLRVLEKYNLPDSFFEALTAWSLPRYGDPAKAIQTIENKLNEGKPMKPSTLRRGEKKKLVRNALQEARRQTRKQLSAPVKSEDKPEIFIHNAGLVLVHPYLPFLFEQLGLMRDGKFIDEARARRAVMLLQYAVTGHDIAQEEEQVLNKLLCGLDITANSTHLKLKKQEKKLVNEMLTALSEHWSVIKGSAPDEVRGNWLVREGLLRECEEYWELVVKRQPYDILLDSLPFTLSPVKHPWMKKMIIIQWL